MTTTPGDRKPAPAAAGELPRRTLLALTLGTAVGGATALMAPPAGAQAAGSSLAGSAAAGGAEPTRHDVVGDWFELVVELAAPPPGVPFAGANERVPAVSWVSALAALRAGRFSEQQPGFADAAVATAVHDALVALVPDQTSRLDSALGRTLSAIPDGEAKQAGIRAGQDAAARTLREHGPEAPGVYRRPPDATEPQSAGWRSLPFLLGRAERFRPAAPIALGTDEYRRDLQELYRLGGDVSERTERQSDIAWLAPQRQYTPALRAVIRVPGYALAWKVRLLAAHAAATLDSGIATAEAKSTYQHWRPVTAIRAADTDGDPLTDPDPSWSSYLGTPANPEYPSAHASYAGAAERVLEQFTGPRTPVAFTATYNRGDGKVVNLEYPRGTRWSTLTQDNIDARVWAGVHFRFSDEAGATLGRRVAAYDLRRLDPTPR